MLIYIYVHDGKVGRLKRFDKSTVRSIPAYCVRDYYLLFILFFMNNIKNDLYYVCKQKSC